MNAIWKFELPMHGEFEMPEGAKILTVQTQREKPYVWAIVNTAAVPRARTLSIYGTGQEIPMHAGRYIGTFQLEFGSLVFHVFEGGPC